MTILDPPPAALPADHRLVFQDDFTASSLDTDKWVHRTDSKLWSTQTKENVILRDGRLHLRYQKESRNGKDYTGAGLISRRTFCYGFFEARFRVPAGEGWHSSFWLMTHDGSGTTNTAGTELEIDIFEQDSVDPRSYYASAHRWKGPHILKHYVVPTPDLSQDFHRLGCLYRPGAADFFFDDRKVVGIDLRDMSAGETSMHLWLTGIACHFGNTTRVDETALPSAMIFDWVRAYAAE